jgi:aryl-alcohol dehydrogenase-like predicted oxidoreductase
MLYRELGASGISVSAVGLGAWAIGGWMWGGTQEDDAIRAIHASLDQGVNLVDTAPVYGYGRSEEIIGKAIRGRRDQVLLATKCGLIWDREEGEFHFHADSKGVTPRPSEKKVYKCLRPDSIRAELEQSLRRLGTDYIDLYQTHWQDSTTPIADTLAALQKLKDEGKIRAIGVSNIKLDQLRAYGQIDADQEKYNMLDRGIEGNGLLAYCRQQNIAMLAYSPLANGLLTGKIGPERQFGEGDLRRMNPRFSKENRQRVGAMLEPLQPIAQRHHASIAKLVIAWTLAQPGITCVLCGARNQGQATENARAAEIALSAEEMEAMDRVVAA